MTCPSMTYAHSAAIPCQWSSRRPPGCRRIETPAMLFEIGKLLVLTSLAVPPGPSQRELLFSRLNLKGDSGGELSAFAAFTRASAATARSGPRPAAAPTHDAVARRGRRGILIPGSAILSFTSPSPGAFLPDRKSVVEGKSVDLGGVRV